MAEYRAVEVAGRVWLPVEVREVLAYCREEEIRIVSASSTGSALLATVERRSASYTRQPVDYLSLTEFAVSLAQAAQLLADDYVKAHPSVAELHPLLVEARLRHSVYFSGFQISFHRPVRGDTYLLDLTLQRFFRIGHIIGVKIAFRVGSSLNGSTICSLGSHYPSRNPQ